MPVRVLDFSHHQSRRNPNGTYTVIANINLVRDSGASGCIVRSNYGTMVDTTAIEHNRRVDAAGLPRAFYWYYLSRQDPVRQAQIAVQQAGSGRRGFIDFEENIHSDGAEPVYPKFSEALWNHANVSLVTCDNITGLLTGIYSSKTKMDSWFTEIQQRRWNNRLGWWAHYTLPGPGIPWVPAGWKNLPLPWCLWQDRIGDWPGIGNVDQNVVWPGLDLNVIFGGTATPVPVPPPPPPPISTAIGDAIGNRARDILRLVG